MEGSRELLKRIGRPGAAFGGPDAAAAGIRSRAHTKGSESSDG
jgi:hypothetical protein